jgi:hypothetical protein
MHKVPWERTTVLIHLFAAFTTVLERVRGGHTLGRSREEHAAYLAPFQPPRELLRRRTFVF